MDIAVIDEMPGVAPAEVMTLRLDGPMISVAGLIRARIEIEADGLEAAPVEGGTTSMAEAALFRARVAQFLVVPGAVERNLNGDRGAYDHGARALPHRRDEHGNLCLDREAMVEVALDGFRRGGFFVLTGEHQLLDLAQEIDVARTTDVTFLKLTPLKGG